MKQENKRNVFLLSIIVLLIFSILSCDLPVSLINLTILANGNGTTHPTGTIEVEYGRPLYVSAVPDPGYVFSTWEVLKGSGVEFGDQNESYTTVALTQEDATIQANFIPNECFLTITTYGNGTTDPEPGGYSVTYGEPVGIQAIPDENWIFVNWEVITGLCNFVNAYDAQTDVIITSANATIRAKFSDNQIPGGYFVSIDQAYIDENNVTALSFTFSDVEEGEVGGTYHYSIDDPNNLSTPPIKGSGTIAGTTQQITDINVFLLDDSLLSLEFYITDQSGNDGVYVYATVLKDTAAPAFISVTDVGDDHIYISGDTISISVNMGESGLTVTADLSVLDSSYSSEQVFLDENNNYYSFNTAPLSSVTMIEGTDVSIEINATDSVHTVTDSFLSLTLDNTPPGGSFVVNDNNGFTSSISVILNITISGAIQMRFVNSLADFITADWVSCLSSIDWTLSPGPGLKTVYGEFRDIAGNVYQTIDTVWLVKKLSGYNGASNDYFGYRVAISSDSSTVVGGAIVGDGIASVAEGNATVCDGTDWGDDQRVMAADGTSGDYFGSSVAVSADGSMIVAGAYLDDILADTDAGSAYVLYGADWFSQVQLIASDVVAGDNFGSSVAISGDGNTVVVGAPVKNFSTGSVYVYDGASWSDEEILTAPDGTANDFFGCSVAIATGEMVRDTIVVGAYGEGGNTGAVYVYEYGGSSWGFTQKITASGGAASDFFGNSVAISGDGNTIVVGAYGEGGNIGAVYVYVYGGSSWGFLAKLTGDAAASDYFGYSVAVSSDGSTIVAGAYRDDDLGDNSGSAYVFSGLDWDTKTLITVDDGVAGDNFGYSVGVSSDGNTVVAGAYGDDDAGTDAGSAYVIPLE